MLALQIYIGGSRFNAESLVSSIVALGITRELGPVLAGLMVAGRVSAAIAAEIGTMRVTEQIDALATLSTNPFKYLVGPRLVAAVIALPLLVVVADIIGVMGGYIVGTRSLGFNSAAYLKNTVDFLEPHDVVSGLVKAAVFGFIIALMGCYHGYQLQGGRPGRGPRHHQCRGLGLDPDPGGELPHRRRSCSTSDRHDGSPYRAQGRPQGLRAKRCWTASMLTFSAANRWW